jgi:hypothetical protein
LANASIPCLVRRLLVRWGMRGHDPSPPDWNEWRENVLVGEVRARTFDLKVPTNAAPTVERAGHEQRDVLQELEPGATLETALGAAFGARARAIASDAAKRARDGRPMYVDMRDSGYAAAFLPLIDGAEIHMTGCVVLAGPCD